MFSDQGSRDLLFQSQEPNHQNSRHHSLSHINCDHQSFERMPVEVCVYRGIQVCISKQASHNLHTEKDSALALLPPA